MALEALHRNGHNLDLLDCAAEGDYNIPIIHPVHLTERLEWISFNCANTARGRERLGVHFFIDDYLFERAWHDPKRYALLLMQYKAVMSPDYSLFTDYPKAVQIYNHYRKHLLAAYWQSVGMTVIPSICWSDHDSYRWCFDGEPHGGLVAVSSIGTQKSPQARTLFADGYREMMTRLQPSGIVFFGDVPKGCEGRIEHHEAFYQSVHNRRKSSKDS